MKSFKSYISVQSFLTYLKRYKLRIAIVLLSFVLSSTLLAFIPLFLGKLVGALSANQINHHDVYVFVALLIGFSFGHSVTWRVSELLYLKLLTPISYRYENIIFRHVINQPYPYFVDKFTGKVSSNITNLSQVFREQLEELFWSYSGYLVGLVGVAIVLAVLNWQTGLLFVCGLATMFLVGRKTIRNSIKYERNLTDVQSTKNGKIIDIIANFVNVKSFQKEKAENQRVIVEQNKTIASASRAYVWSVWFWTSMNFVVRELIWPTTIVLNVYLFLNHKINLATLTALLSAILLFTNYIWSIIWNFSQLSIKFARAEEAYTYLFGKTNIVEEFFNEEELAADIYSLDDSLELQNLHFAYPDNPTHPVLSDINLKIKKNEKVGVVGKSGSGKTTITKLLLGYYPIDKNEILIDGNGVNNKNLPKIISYVPQDTSLFHRSIADNIGYAADREVSRQEIIDAAKKAHAHEFITQIKDQYDALVGERGVKLSAGQRQRIAIARAFLDDKPILILDEATSALDSESEILVQDALEKLWEHKTVIAIAHRLSTLRNMDRIIVLEKGRIIEEGTHEVLISKKGKYAELWTHQSGGFLKD